MKRSGFMLIGCTIMLVLSLTLPFNIAVTSQWFPSSGITVSYSLTHHLTLKSGITVSCSTFNLYNITGYYYLVPTWLDTNYPYPPMGTPIETETSVQIFHSYSEYSPTHLQRITGFSTATQTLFPSTAIDLIIFQSQTEGGSTIAIQSPVETVQKLSYFTTLPSFNFLDYFNCSTGGNQPIFPNTYVTGYTDTQIIAFQRDALDNYTYISGLDGKVLGYSFIRLPTQPSVKSYGFSFTVIPESEASNIPFFSFEWLIVGLCAVGLLFFGFHYLKKH